MKQRGHEVALAHLRVYPHRTLVAEPLVEFFQPKVSCDILMVHGFSFLGVNSLNISGCARR